MEAVGQLAGSPIARTFRSGETSSLLKGQVVVKDSVGVGEIMNPGDVHTYTSAYGTTMAASTYAATSPGQFVKVSCNPFDIVRGKVSGAATSDGAFGSSQILTQTAASTTRFTSAATGTLDYITGNLIILTGTRAGDVRQMIAQSDNTYVDVTIPFGGTIAIGATALRTFGIGVAGINLSSTFEQWVNLLTGTMTLNSDVGGEGVVWDIIVDDQKLSSHDNGVPKISIKNPTAPQVYFDVILTSHAFNT
jgi:hypothetical protein